MGISETGRLPPVLPIVLYNGAQVWNAAETLEPLIEPAPPVLAAYRPRQGYLLLDEQRLAKADSLPMRNLSAALFRLEASRGSGEAMVIVRALIDWLADPAPPGSSVDADRGERPVDETGRTVYTGRDRPTASAPLGAKRMAEPK